MRTYFLPPGRGRCIEIADPPTMDWRMVVATSPCAPVQLRTRILWLRETFRDGKRMLAAYDRHTDTLYLRDYAPDV